MVTFESHGRVESDNSRDTRHSGRGLRIGITYAIVATLLAFMTVLLLPRTYRATARFLPSSSLGSTPGSGALASLGNMASQFGLSLGAGVSNPSTLFPSILRSNRLLSQVLEMEMTLEGDRRATVAEIVLGRTPRTPRDREKAKERLRKDVLRLKFSSDSGVTELSIDSRSAMASSQLANRFVAELDSFYSETKRGLARNRLDFIRFRSEEVASALAQAEEELRDFRLANRQRSDSPDLQLQEARLMRTVALQQEIFTTLKTQEELARIEASSNVPEIVVVDPAITPVRAHAPKFVRNLIRLLIIAMATFVVHMYALGKRKYQFDE